MNEPTERPQALVDLMDWMATQPDPERCSVCGEDGSPGDDECGAWANCPFRPEEG